jgi:hypothetical protein
MTVKFVRKKGFVQITIIHSTDPYIVFNQLRKFRCEDDRNFILGKVLKFF